MTLLHKKTAFLLEKTCEDKSLFSADSLAFVPLVISSSIHHDYQTEYLGRWV